MRRLTMWLLTCAIVFVFGAGSGLADETPRASVIINDIGDNLAGWANQVCNAPSTPAECGKEFTATRMVLSQAVLSVTTAGLAGLTGDNRAEKRLLEKTIHYLEKADGAISGLMEKYNKTEPLKGDPQPKKP